MSVLANLDKEHKNNILKIFMLELSKLSNPSARDRFLFKCLKEQMIISQETIRELKIEVNNQCTSETIEGLVDLSNLMKQIKIQIANEIHPDQAQDLLKTLYNLLNVAGNLNDSFLNELCSDYSSNMVDTEKTAPERTDNLSFDPKPITNELSLNEQSSESKVSDRDLTIRIDGIDQENTQLKKSDITSTDQISEASQSERTDIKIQSNISNLDRYHDLMQKLLFPARDALIISLKIDTGHPIEDGIENNIANPEMRIVATVLDCMIFLISFALPFVIIIILSVILQILGLESFALGFSLIPGFVIFIYYFRLELTKSSTLGKKWMGLKVCSYEGTPINKKAVIIRSLFRSSPLFLSSLATITGAFSNFSFQIFTGLSMLSWISVILGTGYYCIHKRTQGVHDLISKSIVIRYEQPPK